MAGGQGRLATQRARGGPLNESMCVPMAKAPAKQVVEKDDAEQFQQFLEAARKRHLDESLEDFAVKFLQDRAPPKPRVRRPG